MNLEEARTLVKKRINDYMEYRFKPDDRYRLRKAATGQNMPSGIKAKDTSIRNAGSAANLLVDLALTVEDVLAVDWREEFTSRGI